MDDDLIAVLVDPSGVAAEDHRQSVLRQPDAAQRPQIVVVERGRLHGDRGPARRRLRVGTFRQLQPRDWVVLVDARGVDGEHGGGTLSILRVTGDPGPAVGQP